MAKPPARPRLTAQEEADGLLSDRWALYVDAYMANGGNDSAARREVGIRSRMDLPAAVIAARDRRVAARMNELRVNESVVMDELAAIAFSDITNYLDDKGNIDLSKIPEGATAAIKEVRTRVNADGERVVSDIKLHDKLPALTKLGDLLHMFPKRHEITGAGGGPIEVNVKEAAARIADRVRTLTQLADGSYAES